MSQIWLFILVGGLAFGLGVLFGWLGWGREARRATGLSQQLDAQRERFTAAVRDLATAQAQADRLPDLEGDLADQRARREAAEERLAALEAARLERDDAVAAQVQQLTQAREALAVEFQALAAQALRQNEQTFLALAGESFAKAREAANADLASNKAGLDAMIAPMKETLERYQSALADTERQRQTEQGALKQLVASMGETQSQLKTETQRLVHALKSQAKTRGRWGEQQLRNVLENAGLSPYADFQTEVAVQDGALRPDVVIRMPGQRSLVVDAKVSLNAYLEASETDDETARAAALVRHAQSLRTHVQQLSRKSYFDQFAGPDGLGTPDFVVMFIPGEHFLWAAAEQDRDLYDFAYERKVILATPTTLVAVAKTVAQIWRQEKLAENAQEVGRLARELYKRLMTWTDHVANLGKDLDKTVRRYNDMVGSLERSVLPQARRFTELDVEGAAEPLRELDAVETATRLPAASLKLISGGES
jgi:DNA recombination protein RmuC